MLSELKVSHFAIIDNIHICFEEGLNILSGETGAGKSILLKSLALLMGDKSSSESVRTGQDQAVVEGSFDITGRDDILKLLVTMGIETHDDTLVIRRVVSQQGKNRVYINGALSNLSTLQSVVAPLVEVTGQATPLIEMTGQHENRSLLSRQYHLDVVDHFAQILDLRRTYAKEFRTWSDLREERERLTQETRDREQRLDFLRFQAQEIRGLDLPAGAEVDLESRYQRARHAVRLHDLALGLENGLTGDEDSALNRIQKAVQRAFEMAQLDGSASRYVESLNAVKTQLEEVGFELSGYVRNLSSEDLDLEQLEERMSLFRKLQKKYGNTLEDILAQLTEMDTEINRLETADSRLSDLSTAIDKLEKQLGKAAAELHVKRVKAAKKLAEQVNVQLADLNMKGVIFSMVATELTQLGPLGLSQVEFMIQPSAKDTPRPLAKVASGGELSRILLSLKQVVGRTELPRTYLFDEVDTGVSGPTAEKVGRKLNTIAKGQQVICVTHLPQVAAFGDAHFLILKSNSARAGVQTVVNRLDESSRVKEIARLISGEKITKTSLDHAAQLLKDVQP